MKALHTFGASCALVGAVTWFTRAANDVPLDMTNAQSQWFIGALLAAMAIASGRNALMAK